MCIHIVADYHLELSNFLGMHLELDFSLQIECNWRFLVVRIVFSRIMQVELVKYAVRNDIPLIQHTCNPCTLPAKKRPTKTLPFLFPGRNDEFQMHLELIGYFEGQANPKH